MPSNMFYFVLSRVVREQYCMCAPTTQLEKRLVITVVTLVVVIIVLIVIVIVLACVKDEQKMQRIVEALTPTFWHGATLLICSHWWKQNKVTESGIKFYRQNKSHQTLSVVKVCQFGLHWSDAFEVENNIHLRRDVIKKCHADYCP